MEAAVNSPIITLVLTSEENTTTKELSFCIHKDAIGSCKSCPKAQHIHKMLMFQSENHNCYLGTFTSRSKYLSHTHTHMLHAGLSENVESSMGRIAAALEITPRSPIVPGSSLAWPNAV